jgi:hypothetical protein
LESNTTNSFVNDWYSPTATDGEQQFILGGSGNTITHQERTLAIINSEGSIIRDPGEVGYIKTIIGAENSTIQGGAIGVGIFGGRNHLNYAGDGCSIYGGSNNQITGGQNNTIVGGSSNSIPNAQSSFIAGCDGMSIGNGVKNVGLATEAGQFNGDMRMGGIIANYASQFNAPGQHSLLLAGNGNQITGSYTERAIINGNSNTINAGDSNVNNTIMGSDNSTIYVVDTADNNNLIYASSYSVISGKTRASMISTSGQTAVYDDTLHAGHLHTFGQISSQEKDNGTGSTFTIDWNEGQDQAITIDGDTSLTFTNVRQGGDYILYITNTGSFSITAVSASGYTILKSGNPGTITTSGTDLWRISVFGGSIYINKVSNYVAF